MITCMCAMCMPMLLQMCVVGPCVQMCMMVCTVPIQICMAPCQLPLMFATVLCPGALTAVPGLAATSLLNCLGLTPLLGTGLAPLLGAGVAPAITALMPILTSLCGITPLVGTCGGLFTVLSIGLSFAFLPLGLLMTMVALVDPDTITSLCALPAEQIPAVLQSLGLTNTLAEGAQTAAESVGDVRL
jgi:hypothetical protein